MNSQLVGGYCVLLAIAGGASFAAGYAGYLPPWSCWVGGALAFVAVAVQCIAAFRAARADAAFRHWCALLGDAGEPSPPAPSLPSPFDSCARAVRDRVERIVEDSNARTADSRRARIALKALQNDHGAIRALLDNLSDGVLLVEQDGKPSVMNRAARHFLGIGPEEALGATLRDTIRRPALRAPLEEGVLGGSGGGGDRRRSRDIDCSDQTERLVLRVSFREVGPAGAGASEATANKAALAVLLRDVTREVELNRMKSDFASSVSHELKTPLCSMRAFLEMLIDGDIDGEAERTEHLRLVLNETERLTTLVQNLLNLSRLEAGITKMAREPVDVARLLNHLREVVTPLANSRRQVLVFEVSEYMPTVTGDVAMLEQGLMNLVSNAIKYTPEGGSIRVKAGWSGNDLEVVVCDTGVGIPEKALGLIFEKFTRLENHAGLKATGTGLGLPLAKFVAEAHGGRIAVKSEVGKGSEFRMLLPARRGQESSEAVLIGLEGLAR